MLRGSQLVAAGWASHPGCTITSRNMLWRKKLKLRSALLPISLEMKKNPVKKTITKIGMRKTSRGLALPESPEVITNIMMTMETQKTSESNKKIPPRIHRNMYFALIVQLIVLPDPFGTTLPAQAGAKLFRDQRWRFRSQN